jgi:DNA-binding transcriptional ArsR family regulator
MRSEDFNKENRVLKALANSTRLAIVKELLKKEKCVNDIKELLDARQANISQHLAVLRWADIVGCRFVGTTRCYYLKSPEIMSRLLELLKKIKT